MRAVEILQDKLEASLDFMHAKRCAALWRMVEGLCAGRELWLTELGRSLPGDCSMKHRIKAVDRFVGSAAVQGAVVQIYAALASFLLRSVERPVVLVDWTGAEPGFYVLSAKLAFEGRAISILSRAYPEKKKANPAVEKAFLEELKAIIPANCRPVLVTDAGFLFKWIDSVRACGWDYVARARMKKMVVVVAGKCMRVADAYKLAKRKARDLGTVLLGKNNVRAHRTVLSAMPKTTGRQNLGRKGKPRRGGMARAAQAAAREPLLLLTSMPNVPSVVVNIYRTRMQIEQTFRDQKSYRNGWASRHIRTTHPHRIDVLLLIGALAAVALHLVGLTIRGTPLAFSFQANTERRRMVFSTFFLGKLAVRESIAEQLSLRSLLDALAELLSRLRSVQQISA